MCLPPVASPVNRERRLGAYERRIRRKRLSSLTTAPTLLLALATVGVIPGPGRMILKLPADPARIVRGSGSEVDAAVVEDGSDL